MRALMNTLTIAAISLTALSLTGCSVRPTETNIKSAVQELEERGFTDPRWEDSANTFTVGFGSCRFPIRQGYQDWTVVVPSMSGQIVEVRGANATLQKMITRVKECLTD